LKALSRLAPAFAAATAVAAVAYHPAPSGALTLAGTYYPHGLGGILSGSVVDHAASEGALTYDRASGLLFAVNPGRRRGHRGGLSPA
jgi:hypothetical protein